MSRWTSDTSPRSCMMSASELRGGRSRASSLASFSLIATMGYVTTKGLPAVASMIDISTIFHGRIGRFRIRTTSWSGS